jgi:hypothetical protein
MIRNWRMKSWLLLSRDLKRRERLCGILLSLGLPTTTCCRCSALEVGVIPNWIRYLLKQPERPGAGGMQWSVEVVLEAEAERERVVTRRSRSAVEADDAQDHP